MNSDNPDNEIGDGNKSEAVSAQAVSNSALRQLREYREMMQKKMKQQAEQP